jgi:hypothetical protein
MIDAQSSHDQGAAAPQYSPDGRWWWNGQEWQPVPQQAARPPASSRRRRPGRRLYLVALLLAVLAPVLVGLVIRSFVSGFPATATRITGPGTTEITLAEQGTYTISYERQTSGNVGGGFELGGAPLDNVPSGTLKLVSTASGAPVSLRAPSGTFTYSVGNTEGQAVAEFDIDSPGTYSLVSQYENGQSGPPFVLAIAHGSPSNTVIYVLGGLAAIALLFIGCGLAVLTLILRRRG